VAERSVRAIPLARRADKQSEERTVIKRGRETQNSRTATATAVARRPISPKISEEDIRSMAYKIFQERIRYGRPGTPAGDWLEAERRLRGKPS
jgi:hypothetical protein